MLYDARRAVLKLLVEARRPKAKTPRGIRRLLSLILYRHHGKDAGWVLPCATAWQQPGSDRDQPTTSRAAPMPC